VFAISGASILIKLSTADPLVIGFYRLAFTVLILLVPFLLQKRAPIARRDVVLSSLSGLFLAAHFATWFFSLKLTSVASSTILVNTHPFIVLLVGYVAWGERPAQRALTGVGIAVLGAMLVGWGDFAMDSRGLWGDLLAFLGAVTVSGYFLLGRHIRQRVDAIAYSVMVYSVAAVVLLGAALLSGSSLTNFSPVNWWIFVGLAVFPTVFGHTLFNWALKYLPPAVISVNILGEPLAASFLAWLIWRSMPNQLSLVGGALLLVGIAVFLYNQARTTRSIGQLEGSA
jgi:drug/metabolite transporter (DMT)-like permease